MSNIKGHPGISSAVGGVRDGEKWESSRPAGDTPWKRFRDEAPVYDGEGERHLLTWNTRVATYDIGCIDGEWIVGEPINGHPDDLWRWLHGNPETALLEDKASRPCETMGPEDMEPGCCGPCRARSQLAIADTTEHQPQIPGGQP